MTTMTMTTMNTVWMTVNIIVITGDVEISAPGGLTCANVETTLSFGNSALAIIAAPTPAAQRTGIQARSHVPEAGCWTSVRLVKTGAVT